MGLELIELRDFSTKIMKKNYAKLMMNFFVYISKDIKEIILFNFEILKKNVDIFQQIFLATFFSLECWSEYHQKQSK